MDRTTPRMCFRVWLLLFTILIELGGACEYANDHRQDWGLKGLDFPATCGKLGSLNSSQLANVNLLQAEQEPLGFLAAESNQSVMGEDDTALICNHIVRPALGKGLGVFATRLIPKGTRIIVESPLITIQVPEMIPGQGYRIADMIADIKGSFQALTMEQQEEFLQLHDFRFPSETGQSHLLTIFRSNAYSTGDSRAGLFPRIARINHSCKPNSGNWWSEKSGERIIYAARDITEGEEVTVSYIPLLKTTKERQARLRQYGFVCGCEACTKSHRDKFRVEIAETLGDLEQKVYSTGKKKSFIEKRISRAVALIQLVEAEGLTDYLARSYRLAAMFNLQAGAFADAEQWVRKELAIWNLAEDDSSEALAALAFIREIEEMK